MAAAIRKIPCAFLRGGTSKGLFFHARDLPASAAERDSLILRAMGSPDATGMQLDGMGGGISSTSKVVIVSKKNDHPSGQPMVNYFFGQVSLKDAAIDWSGSCGNLASALGLFALQEGGFEDCYDLVTGSSEGTHSPRKKAVRVWQENQGYEMQITLTNPAEQSSLSAGDLISIPGVPGASPPILVEFKDITAGSQSGLFPTGNVKDFITLDDGETVCATLVAGANPTIIASPSALALHGAELPSQISYGSIAKRIEELRRAGASAMGIDVTDALRVAWVSPPRSYEESSGQMVSAEHVDLLSRITTPGRVHHAHTGTGAINVAVAAAVPGTVANSVLSSSGNTSPKSQQVVRIGHPGGVMQCTASVELEPAGGIWRVKAAGFVRTARYLMSGFVHV